MTVRLPHDGYRPVSCDNDCHHRRGSLGGTDYAMPVGTPLHAPASGMARARVAGTGGYTVTITRPNGDVIELMHLSSFVGMRLGGPSIPVVEGQRVGYSGGRKGAPGAGSSTGPHCHVHITPRGGARTALIPTTTRPAAGPTTPVAVTPQRKRRAMTIGHIKRIGTPPNNAIYAVDLEKPGAPLRAIGWAEYKAGFGAGIELAEIAALPGDPIHPFDAIVRERGVIMVGEHQRPIPYDTEPKPDPGRGYELINWEGLAVSRPKG